MYAVPPTHDADVDALAAFLRPRRRLFVLTGAGCSTDSGIPDYRDDAGDWKRREPIRYAQFVRSEPARKRYWARSMIGWPRMAGAAPNDAHGALAALEDAGRVDLLVTQNVDGLHRRAGSHNVIEIHGDVFRTTCMQCLEEGELDLEVLADLEATPLCASCGGPLRPRVVLFGEMLPLEDCWKITWRRTPRAVVVIS